jgi:curved DNA-binding protein CbpA
VNHYERLKVTQDAPPEVIRAAYRALANRLHPDRAAAVDVAGAAHEQMAALNAAYEVLIDPVLRRDYDASLSTAVSWRAAVAEDPFEPGRDPSTGVTPSDLVAPVSAWAPELKHILMAGAGLLVVTAAGLAWFLSGSPSSSLDAAMSSQLGRERESVAIEAVRRGESSAMLQVGGVGGRRPSVEELARMSDEELLAAMPALDEKPQSLPDSPGRSNSLASAGKHPLDGPGLRLKTDADLMGSYAAVPAPVGRP